MPTPRALAFALVIPALLLAGTWQPVLVPLAGAYAVGLLVLLAGDWLAASGAGQFRVARQHDSKLSLGAENRVTVRVTSRAKRPVALAVQDEPPLPFAGEEASLMHADLLPLETHDFTYTVRPLKRGDYRFGDVNLRWNSPLGLVVRQARFPAAGPVKVYPNLHEIRKYELLARRDQLAEMGLRGVRLRGEGTMFESLREYTPDDPYRRINWKATARRARPISMEYEPERSQRVVIAVDVGRMMRSPIHVHDPGNPAWNMAKVDFVINSVLLFSYVATLKGDQVGLLVFADRVKSFIPPRAGPAHFQKLLEAMYALESEPVEADYGRALMTLGAQNKKRSLVVVFTDLSGARASEALARYVPSLLPRHLPLLVTIRDPALDQEAGQQPSNSDSVYRRMVAEQLITERRLLLDRLQRQGVLTLDVSAEHMTMAVVNRYLQVKARSLA
ncbi:DUF58 domain-containing protein [Aggregatilinea lenta]|uniref:DUF58 domain-containing protein n=1 Tax=Aggregatilinea lenta TaxID=913108 RepID=UPI000E5B96B6|nr:DUF58 domain-containing protein [Aggregatilinea lenta]